MTGQEEILLSLPLGTGFPQSKSEMCCRQSLLPGARCSLQKVPSVLAARPDPTRAQKGTQGDLCWESAECRQAGRASAAASTKTARLQISSPTARVKTLPTVHSYQQTYLQVCDRKLQTKHILIDNVLKKKKK